MRALADRFTKGFIVTAAAAALLTAPAVAHATTFDLESLNTGTFTSVSQAVGGLGIVIHRADNDIFEILDITGTPPAFGSRTIANFDSAFDAGATMVVNFTNPVRDASISFGDFAGDDDGSVVLTAWSGLNGTGTNLGTVSIPYPASLTLANGNSAIRTLTAPFFGIQSFTILSGGPFPGTMFFDNVAATAVPEPASMILIGTGLAGLAARRRSRR